MGDNVTGWKSVDDVKRDADERRQEESKESAQSEDK